MVGPRNSAALHAIRRRMKKGRSDHNEPDGLFLGRVDRSGFSGLTPNSRLSIFTSVFLRHARISLSLAATGSGCFLRAARNWCGISLRTGLSLLQGISNHSAKHHGNVVTPPAICSVTGFLQTCYRLRWCPKDLLSVPSGTGFPLQNCSFYKPLGLYLLQNPTSCVGVGWEA